MKAQTRHVVCPTPSKIGQRTARFRRDFAKALLGCAVQPTCILGFARSETRWRSAWLASHSVGHTKSSGHAALNAEPELDVKEANLLINTFSHRRFCPLVSYGTCTIPCNGSARSGAWNSTARRKGCSGPSRSALSRPSGLLPERSKLVRALELQGAQITSQTLTY